MKDYGILPQNIIKLEQQGIPPHIYNGKYDGYTITKGARDINSNDIAEKLIKMYEKIHSKFTEQELNEIRALAIKFEEKYKANVTKRTLSPAVAVAFYKDEAKGIYRYSIAINSNPAKQGEKIVVKDLDESLQLKVNEIANNKTEIIYEGSHGEGSHAEVKAVNKIIKSLKDEGIEYNPDNVIVYVNSTHNVTLVPKEISFVKCPHCSYILDDFMALSDCEIVESGTKLRDNFFEEYNMNFGDKTLQKFELNKDICIEMASYESSDTAIILSPK